MKPIPGYEIVEGGSCGDCDLYEHRLCLEMHASDCDYDKIYKKKEEKTMTYDKFYNDLKKFSALLDAASNKKTIQKDVGFFDKHTHWADVPIEDFSDIKLSNVDEYRIKPSLKVIPWTEKDSDSFKSLQIEIFLGVFTEKVHSWNNEGVYFQSPLNNVYFYTYVELATRQDTNGNPCGKVVEE